MQYAIFSYREGLDGRVALSEAEYRGLLQDYAMLTEALMLEERFDILLGNYLEFESEIVDLAMQHSIRFHTADEEMPEHRRILVRRVLNLLNACFFYLDQLWHGLSGMFGSSSVIAQSAKQSCAAHYDSSFGYRLMESVRNSFQHYSMPIQMLAVNHQRTEIGAAGQFACTVTPKLSRDALLGDPKLKEALKSELRTQPEHMDIKPLIREYVEALAELHDLVRKEASGHVKGWDESVDGIFNRYARTHDLPPGEEPMQLELVELDAPPTVCIRARKAVTLRIVELRKALERRNSHLQNLARRYATNQPSEDIPSP